jgi:hypothetical protein
MIIVYFDFFFSFFDLYIIIIIFFRNPPIRLVLERALLAHLERVPLLVKRKDLQEGKDKDLTEDLMTTNLEAETTPVQTDLVAQHRTEELLVRGETRGMTKMILKKSGIRMAMEMSSMTKTRKMKMEKNPKLGITPKIKEMEQTTSLWSNHLFVGVQLQANKVIGTVLSR